ncbi:trypsin-like peptidase domain-containing protein [Streptomyces sp. NPDC088674]|uniref:VMAP-C domain-containing protein n=1 Tax=Streptomyces sp. NPDC088674 TaxID=3365869 RepID=UPI0038148C0E
MNGGGEGQPVWKILEDLTKAATVRIHVPRAGYSPLDTVQEAGLFLGSGFLAAPQWVLTCAHVLFDGAAQRPVGKGERVIVCQVGPSGLPFALEGEVAAVLPEHVPATGSWPAPDLALVRLRRPAPYTCAYLSDRPAGTQLDGSGLYQVGWIDNGGQLTLRGGAVTVAGTLGGPGEAEQLLLKGEGFIAGSSGGPVVDLRRGEVVAVVKSRLREGGSGSAVDLACLRSLAVPGLTAERATPPFGTMLPDGPWWEGAASGRAGTGLAAPAPAAVLPGPRVRDAAAYGDAPGPVPEPPEPEEDLYQALYRDHDRYHASQLAGAAPTWTDAQRSLWGPGARPGPLDRTRLYGLFAGLPHPAAPAELATLLRALPLDLYGADRPHPPRAWRDGFGVLRDRAGGTRDPYALALRYVLAVLHAATPAPAAAPLHAAAPVAAALPPADGLLAAETREAAHALRKLRDWAADAADELPPEIRAVYHTELADWWRAHERPAPASPRPRRRAARRAVVLRVDALGWQPGHVTWGLAVEEGGTDGPEPLTESVHESADAVPLRALPAALAGPLADAFRRCDEPGAPAMLHVALPHDLLGLEVDTWPDPSGGGPLGAVRPVVVRCASREQFGPGAEVDPVRWAALHPRGPGAEGVHGSVLDCAGGTPRALADDLVTLPAEIPVLCQYRGAAHPVTGDALPRLVRAGYGVALWRRRGEFSRTYGMVPGYAYDGNCSGFHTRVGQEVRAAHSAAQLPYVLHDWRRAAEHGQGWSEGVVLMYDPPRAAPALLAPP